MPGIERNPVVLELERVCKAFPAAEGGPPLSVLKDLDLRVAAGEALAIVGPSGSGKSTLLHLLGALERPTAGTVRLEGLDLATQDDQTLASLRNRRIGFVFQAHHLLPQCSLLENVLVPTLVCPDPALRAAAPERAKALLARVGLGERMGHRPAQLSGGERQRAAVVRALINQPCLLLADEPTGALDQGHAGEIGELLLELNRETQVTLIVVTHAETLARRLGRILELQAGSLRPLPLEPPP